MRRIIIIFRKFCIRLARAEVRDQVRGTFLLLIIRQNLLKLN